MLPLDRILAPTDFSANSLIALAQAGTLARHFRAQVTLLHVAEFPIEPSFTTAAQRAEYLSAKRKELMEFGAAELSDVAVKRIVCCGDPAKVILARAYEERPDLILMPPRGNGVFRRFLLGSVTSKVLHDAECPVWTGAHVADPAERSHGEIRSVLCAVDFGLQTVKTVHWAAEFSRSLGAKLTVVHAVLDTPPNLPDRYCFQWHEEAHSGARERLHELLIDCEAAADVMVIADGDVPKSLARAAKETRADLLVIGRGTDEGRPGSQTFPIVCSAACQVVSV